MVRMFPFCVYTFFAFSIFSSHECIWSQNHTLRSTNYQATANTHNPQEKPGPYFYLSIHVHFSVHKNMPGLSSLLYSNATLNFSPILDISKAFLFHSNLRWSFPPVNDFRTKDFILFFNFQKMDMLAQEWKKGKKHPLGQWPCYNPFSLLWKFGALMPRQSANLQVWDGICVVKPRGIQLP